MNARFQQAPTSQIEQLFLFPYIRRSFLIYFPFPDVFGKLFTTPSIVNETTVIFDAPPGPPSSNLFISTLSDSPLLQETSNATEFRILQNYKRTCFLWVGGRGRWSGNVSLLEKRSTMVNNLLPRRQHFFFQLTLF
jgi:hypothetical protein